MHTTNLSTRNPLPGPVTGIDEAELVAAYDACNAGDFGPMHALMAPEGYVHRLPSLDLELHGRDEAVAALRRLYDERQVCQAPVRWHQHGELVVLDVEGTSLLRGRFEAVHVCLVRDGVVLETTVAAPPLPVQAPRPAWLPRPLSR
ncbi:MAG TPA: nuclear transport factor 2 family protein [Mycobacteriales bacterium]|nr:nuclear transport factor 2 family protein [Mycobacteriales bacterium]